MRGLEIGCTRLWVRVLHVIAASAVMHAGIASAALAPPTPLPTGPCGDPWVSAAVQRVMNRPATGSGKNLLECDINRYGNGQWSSYDDLVNKVNAAYGICRDKWVTAAVWEVKGRKPQGSGDTGECDYKLYGGGSWSGYSDLVQKVRIAVSKPNIMPPAVAIAPTPAPVATPPAVQVPTPVAQPAPSGVRAVTGTTPSSSAPSPSPSPASAPSAASTTMPSASVPKSTAAAGGGFRQDGTAYIGADPNYGRPTPTPAPAPAAAAGSCSNPMLTAAIANARNPSLTGSGVSGACDPKRYKGGSWQSQSELNSLVIQSLQCTGTVEQAWIGQAYAELGYRYPRRIKYSNSTSSAPYDIDECDLKLYGTSFSSYDDLKTKIARYETQLKQSGGVAQAGASGASGGTSSGGGSSSAGGTPGAGGAKPPGAGAPAGGDTPIGQLEPFDNGAALLRDGVAAIDIADSLASAMQSVASGNDALVDADVAAEAMAAVRAARYLLNGPNNPYSLAKLISGSVVAMDDEDRRLLNRMIAEDGLADHFRETKAALTAAQWAHQRAVLAMGTSFLERSSAQFSGPALRQYADAKQRLTFDGNDRAQQLVSMLSFGRAMYTGSTFMSAATQVEQTASSFVEIASEKLAKSLPGAIGLSGLQEEVLKLRLTKFATTYTIAKVTVLMSTAALNAMAANLPTSISGFYMTLNDRKYVANASAWPMKTGDANAIVARVYVVPHAPGGQVITPLSIIGTVVDVAGVSGVMKHFDKLQLNAQMKQTIQAALEKAKTTWSRIGHAQVDNMLSQAAGKTWFPTWASSAQNYFSFNQRNLNPVEINDIRVVKLTPGLGGNDGKIAVGTQGNRYKVTGVGAGATGIRGELTPAVESLYSGGGEKYFNIAINVTDDKPPGGPWKPCGRPGDGGITNPYTGQCVYPQ